MLNRRYLRIKAMQNIFAFFQCRQADYHLALELIREEFSPDLNSMEVQDPVKLQENRKVSLALFARSYEQLSLPANEEYTDQQGKATQEALAYYDKQVKKDIQHLRKNMLIEVEKIAERYLEFLLLLVELGDFARQERDKRLAAGRAAKENEINWFNNQLIAQLARNKPLELAAIKANLHWKEEQEFVKQLYKELLKNDENFAAYLNQAAPSFEDDRKIVQYMVKKVLFKHQLVSDFMEARDLYWAENQEILKSMVLRTVKSFDAESDEQHELAELSYNWEEDKEFFLELFDLSIRNERKYEEMISAKSKNWEVDRIAQLDKVILILALCEMINFSSIPVKVTINEYIELSKKYSTPKSKFFVNGVLDVLSGELQEKGVIRKSGRGLIDNK